MLYSLSDFEIDPVLAAVGQLQFEVVESRMLTEYGVETRYEPLPFQSPDAARAIEISHFLSGLLDGSKEVGRSPTS